MGLWGSDVSAEHLGLFDTPPERQDTGLALLVVCVVFLALGVLLIAPDLRLRQINAFIPMVDSVIMVGDLTTATLLYVEALVFRSRAITVLASGYFFGGLLILAHALSFPDAFAAEGLIGGGINTTPWIAYFWRGTIPAAVILYVLLRTADENSKWRTKRPWSMIMLGLSAAVACASAVVLLTTVGHDLLPSIFLTPARINFTNTLRINWALIALLGAATVMLYRRRSSVLDSWLLVALATCTAHALLNLETWGRFTVGFYSQFILLVFSHFLVMLALIAETNRLYARLALSTAARKREHDHHLMSLDAVAAAISHEIGQPLSASLLNARAGLGWLARQHPNVEKAIEALRSTIEDEQRTFDVLKSVRTMFTNNAPSFSEFSFGDLVRETVLLLDKELAARKISLELSLDEALPPITADRVQMQRVLINILINAIQSLGSTRRRTRKIRISSASPDDKSVQLEISDTGRGIAPDKIEQMFEPFFTTKPKGTGLGLSLCRLIVEDHGGQLWAAPGEKHGMSVILKLPRSELLAA